MKVSELIHFDKQRYFNGAVQADWFYDANKVHTIASSYVFHGPKYYGVSDTDVSVGRHRLIDTASFTQIVSEKLYSKDSGNCFLMTIAGYGTGKSHLTVSLASLFAGDVRLRELVTDNIDQADSAIAERIKSLNNKPNLVLVLNGMNNFNLDAEILRCARVVLGQHGISDDILQKLTKSYDIAQRFVENMFDYAQKQFEAEAKEHGLSQVGSALKKYLITHLESDSHVLAIINAVFYEMNGDYIHWERGISAGDILTELYRELCGMGKPFHKILILFDEFGRYIEYVAANPTIAGDASLQQIFEATQAADGGIIFTGFIQSELEAYLSRIEKSSNIIRYVGRYKASETVFLSSNFETILANLIQKLDSNVYDRVINHALTRYGNYHERLHRGLLRWSKSSVKKSVWLEDDLYRSVILKGCYPLHPITVWLLSNAHQWMQQRSAITFVAEMIDAHSNQEIQGPWLPYILPIRMIESAIYDEMLNAEEKGLVQSQYCMLYRDILVKVGDKLTTEETATLQGILITNIGRMDFVNKEEALLALGHCTGLKDEVIAVTLKSLEDHHGIIMYDEKNNSFDMMAEANGWNEFKRIFSRYRFGTKATIEDCDEKIRIEMGVVQDLPTAFGVNNKISATEWTFNQVLLDVSSITENFLRSTVRKLTDPFQTDVPRGTLLIAYCAQNCEEEVIRLSKLYRDLELQKYALHILFLDDAEKEILNALHIRATLNKFSSTDRTRFQKQISDQHRLQSKNIIKAYNALSRKRNYIGSGGIVVHEKRLSILCSDTFQTLYASAPPFMFDGFEKKNAIQARKYLSTICIKLFDRTLMNIQSYQALTQEEKNRVKATLTTGVPTSWGVFDDSCQLITPQNTTIATIHSEVETSLSFDEAVSVYELFSKYTQMPYGMSEQAVALFVLYFIAIHEKELLCYYDSQKLLSSHLSDAVFKQGKLNMRELGKIRLQKNQHVNRDLVAEKCREILKNTSVENCAALRNALKDLIAQEGEQQENLVLIASAYTRLDEGLQLYRTIYEKLSKAEELLEATKDRFVIHRFVNIFKHLGQQGGELQSGLPYELSDQYKAKQVHLKKMVEQIIAKNYLSALQKLTCKITQLSQLKAQYKRVAEILSAEGYTSLAKQTTIKVDELEQSILAKQKYESTLIELDKGLSFASNPAKFTAEKCITAKSELNNWLLFIQSTSDLPDSIKKPYIDKIDRAIRTIETRSIAIETELESLCHRYDTMSTTDDLKAVRNTLPQLEALGFDNSVMMEWKFKAECIEKTLHYIDGLAENIDELNALLNESNSIPQELHGIVVRFAIEEKRDRLQSKENQWLRDRIDLSPEYIESMSVADCKNWIAGTKHIPDYTSQCGLEKYNVTADLIERRLHHSRVEGAVAIFQSLDEVEKRQFLSQIKSIM